MTEYTTLKRFRVLVVEDEELNAEVVTSLLRNIGHTTTRVVATGEEAVRAAREDRPDVVLMDVRLAGEMDGIEAARIINREGDLPIIFLTAFAPDLLTGQDPDSPADCYITKPVRAWDLSANIQLAVARREMQRRLKASEARYRFLFDNTLAGIYQADLEGRILSVNQRLAEMLGYESDQAMVDRVRNMAGAYYVEPERLAELMAILGEKGEALGFVSEVYGSDGDLLWVMEHVRLVRDGETPCFQGVVVDVTEPRLTRQNLEATLNMIEQTIDSLPAPLVLLDLDENPIMANAPYRRQFKGEISPAQSLEPRSRELWREAFADFKVNGLRRDLWVNMAESGVWRRLSLAPYRDPRGELIGAVCLFDSQRAASPPAVPYRSGEQTGESGQGEG